jgi:hypothetical protein
LPFELHDVCFGKPGVLHSTTQIEVLKVPISGKLHVLHALGSEDIECTLSGNIVVLKPGQVLIVSHHNSIELTVISNHGWLFLSYQPGYLKQKTNFIRLLPMEDIARNLSPSMQRILGCRNQVYVMHKFQSVDNIIVFKFVDLDLRVII